MVLLVTMKKYGVELQESRLEIPLVDFLESFNKNMPADFPRASVVLLKKFKEAHATLFKNGDLWSLERHRKRLIDWLSQQTEAL